MFNKRAKGLKDSKGKLDRYRHNLKYNKRLIASYYGYGSSVNGLMIGLYC